MRIKDLKNRIFHTGGMDEEKPFKPLAAWKEDVPEVMPMSLAEWRSYIETLEESLPAGTTLNVREAVYGNNLNKSPRLVIKGPDAAPNRPSFEAITYFLPENNAMRLLSINSEVKGMGHTVLFAQLAAGTRAGFDHAYIRAGSTDGAATWAYWGVPLDFNGSPDFDRKEMAKYEQDIVQPISQFRIGQSDIGRTVVDQLQRRSRHALTNFVHKAEEQPYYRSKAVDILRKAGNWDGHIRLGETSADLVYMFGILDRHHRRRGTKSMVTWRPLKPGERRTLELAGAAQPERRP